MLGIALIIGVFSYFILLLGLFQLLNFSYALFALALFVLLFGIFLHKSILKTLTYFIRDIQTYSKIELLFLLLLVLLTVVNLIGALGPELSFDALWYHLTIPKLFVNAESVYFIKGELLYYSLWPKLTELLYSVSLIFGDEIHAKLIHFSFGILSTLIVYKIARLYIQRLYAIGASLIFYSNLVVAWLSMVSYVDLTRSFYEAIALFYFLKYLKSLEKRNLFYSAILLGFAISTKLLSVGSVLIFILLIVFAKLSIKEKFKNSFLYLLISLLVPLPYFLISFNNTGNPVYPLFTKLFSSYFTLELLNPFNFIKSTINVFLFSSDPLNPVYFIILPFLFFSCRKIMLKARYIFLYSIVSFFVFYFTPQTGGGRFIVAYLPAFSVLAAILIATVGKKLRKIFLFIIILISMITLFYRITANLRFVPVILGYQSKSDFLMHNLNFSFGDFYDENEAIKKIVKNDRVMIIGIHNLYYVDFPFTIPEWDSDGTEKYTLMYTFSMEKSSDKRLAIYKNPVTHVTLYQNYAE